MEKPCDIIDLCDIKTIKSEDSSDTIPFHERTVSLNVEDVDAVQYTEQWINSLRTNGASEEVPRETEQQHSNVENSSAAPVNSNASSVDKQERKPIMVPLEFTDLVNKDCVIKLINSLMTHAIHKSSEIEMRRKIISIAPDIYPQIDYHTSVGFQFVHQKCVELFYQALLEFFVIFKSFTIPMQNLIISWMYNVIEDMCCANYVDGAFLRQEGYIEKLIMDFNNVQKQTLNPDNIFFNTNQKLLPMPNVAQSDAAKSVPNNEKAKRQRKSRVTS